MSAVLCMRHLHAPTCRVGEAGWMAVRVGCRTFVAALVFGAGLGAGIAGIVSGMVLVAAVAALLTANLTTAWQAGAGAVMVLLIGGAHGGLIGMAFGSVTAPLVAAVVGLQRLLRRPVPSARVLLPSVRVTIVVGVTLTVCLLAGGWLSVDPRRWSVVLVGVVLGIAATIAADWIMQPAMPRSVRTRLTQVTRRRPQQ